MYTWEIQNHLNEIEHIFESYKEFYHMVETSPQVNRIRAGEVHERLFEMYISSLDGLDEKVFIKK